MDQQGQVCIMGTLLTSLLMVLDPKQIQIQVPRGRRQLHLLIHGFQVIIPFAKTDVFKLFQ